MSTRRSRKQAPNAAPDVHGANLRQKEQHPRKYRDDQSRQLLAEIRAEYDRWRTANETLIGPQAAIVDDDVAIIQKRTELFEIYKRFLDQDKYATKFDSRSNLHSSALEEFMYYLFRDLVQSFNADALIGKSHTFKDLFFVPSSYADMLKRPGGMVETKDHDFVIGATVWASLSSVSPTNAADDAQQFSKSVDTNSEQPRTYTTTEPNHQADEGVNLDNQLSIQAPLAISENSELHRFDIPAVAIECKTYLDKTMLESSARAAEELKARNPNGIYIVVMERIKLTENVNLRKYKLDQIYILRRQRNKDREFRIQPGYDYKPIDFGVVWHLFSYVRKFLTRHWETGLEAGIDRGYLINDNP